MTRGLFYVETFGCQMNEQDTLRMSERLAGAGYLKTDDLTKAALILVNTCSIRKKAEEKAYSLIGRLRTIKRHKPHTIIAVAGCVAQQEGARLQERMPFIDIVCGPHYVGRVEELLERFRIAQKGIVEVSQARGADGLDCEGIPGPSGLKAYVTIMEGCNNFCAYCVVPYVRGTERSRPYLSITREVQHLIRRGVKDITLLGQNVNSYTPGSPEGFGFADLLRRLAGTEGMERLRFTTSHPKDLSEALVACYGELTPLCEHIHLPLQSGSDKILAAMNREYTVDQYRKNVERLRARIPEIAITSDIIVGFPGETEKDFNETLQAVKEIRFDNLFSFTYSPRPGTKASLIQETLSDEEKGRRLRELQACQGSITLQAHQRMVGMRVEVLVEGMHKESQQLTGRTRTNTIVNFAGPECLMGQRCEIEVVRGCKNSLVGCYHESFPKNG